jgi:DNA repair protein RadC
MTRRGLGEASGTGLFPAAIDQSDSTDEARPHYHGHRARLRERFLKEPSALPDYELLEMILAMAQPRLDTKPVAKALLAKFHNSLAEIVSASPDSLREVEGIGEVSVVALKALQETAQRLLRPKMRETDVISSWSALLDYLTARAAYDAIEQFRVLYLDRKNRIIADEALARGTVDHTPVYPREVVKRALELQASALIMVHNHPSGDPKPSRADIDMTNKVKEAAAIVGVTLHDHIIVSRGGNVSFRSTGLI